MRKKVKERARTMKMNESKTMTTAEVLVQLSSLKDNSASFAKEPGADPIWSDDIRALETVIELFSILEDEGITDAEVLKDFIHDYDLTVKTNKEYNRKFGTPERAYPKDDVWHCPECNHRVQVNHSYCHWCGKRLFWR